MAAWDRTTEWPKGVAGDANKADGAAIDRSARRAASGMLADMGPPAKVALVTGGAKRVGRAIVETLASAGCDIALTYRTSESEACDLVALLRDAGRKALAIQVDLTDPEPAVEKIEREIRSAFGDRKSVV